MNWNHQLFCIVLKNSFQWCQNPVLNRKRGWKYGQVTKLFPLSSGNLLVCAHSNKQFLSHSLCLSVSGHHLPSDLSTNAEQLQKRKNLINISSTRSPDPILRMKLRASHIWLFISPTTFWMLRCPGQHRSAGLQLTGPACIKMSGERSLSHKLNLTSEVDIVYLLDRYLSFGEGSPNFRWGSHSNTPEAVWTHSFRGEWARTMWDRTVYRGFD